MFNSKISFFFFSCRKIGSKRFSNLLGGAHQLIEKSEVRERFLTDRLVSRGNVFVAIALSETAQLSRNLPFLLCRPQSLFLSASQVSKPLVRMISQNKCLFSYMFIFTELSTGANLRGRCSTAPASSLPPPMTTCFLPQHLDPPQSAAAFSVPGPMAPSVTAQVLCEQWPLWLPCHRPAAFSLSTDFNRFPSHFCCQPDARPHTFPPPFHWPPVSVRSFRDSLTHPICPLTPPSLMATHLLGLCLLSSPRRDTVLRTGGNEMSRPSLTCSWQCCSTELQINLNFVKRSITNMPTSYISLMQRLSRSRPRRQA